MYFLTSNFIIIPPVIKPAVSAETAKVWTLSANDVLDDDIVRFHFQL